MFYKKGVLRNFTEFTRKHLYQSFFFDKFWKCSLFLFFPSKGYIFSLQDFCVECTCYFTVSTYFQISFKNLLLKKQFKTGRKIIHEWKVFYLNCVVKDCKHCIPFQNVHKLSEGEQKTADLVWLASMNHILQVKLNLEKFLIFWSRKQQNRNALEVSLK